MDRHGADAWCRGVVPSGKQTDSRDLPADQAR